MNRLNKALSLMLVFITLSMTITTMADASGTVVYDSTIVVFGNRQDTAIKHAIDILVQENSISKILDFGSIEYTFEMALHLSNDIILVGHGTEQGILAGNKIISWAEYGAIASKMQVKNQLHFVNCNSENVKPFLDSTKTHALTFKGEIDAFSAAYISTIYMQIARGNLGSITTLIQKVRNNFASLKSNVASLKDNLLGMGLWEGTATAADFLSFVIILVANAYISISKLFGFTASTWTKVKYIMSAFRYAMNAQNYWNSFLKIVDFLNTMWDNNLKGYLGSVMSYWDYILIVTEITAFLAITVLTSGAAPYIKFIASLAWAVGWVYWFTVDWNDADDSWKATTSSSSTSPPSGVN